MSVIESPVSYARGLSDPLQPNRLKALKGFGDWMNTNGSQYAFTAIEVDQVWRALQLTLWMADKRPVQQQVAAECVLFIRKIAPSLLVDWNRGFWYNIERVYETIDKFRVPKFHLLIRIYVSELLHQMNLREFETEFVHAMLAGVTSNLKRATGAYIQFVSVFVDELSKEVGDFSDSIKPEAAFAALLEPAFHIIQSGTKYPLSLVSKTLDNILTRELVVNYSTKVRNLIKNNIKKAAMAKNVEQDMRDVLFAAIESIDTIESEKPTKLARQ